MTDKKEKVKEAEGNFPGLKDKGSDHGSEHDEDEGSAHGSEHDDEEIEVPVVGSSDRMIRDVDLILNTGETGIGAIQTEVLNGELLAIIPSADRGVKVTVRFTGVPEIVLYENRAFQGTFYLPLKLDPIASDARRFNYSATYWYLNNSLTILVEGPINTELRMTVRYKDYGKVR